MLDFKICKSECPNYVKIRFMSHYQQVVHIVFINNMKNLRVLITASKRKCYKQYVGRFLTVISLSVDKTTRATDTVAKQIPNFHHKTKRTYTVQRWYCFFDKDTKKTRIKLLRCSKMYKCIKFFNVHRITCYFAEVLSND